MEAGAEVNRIRNPVDRKDHHQYHVHMVPQSDTKYGRRERVDRQERIDSSRERRMYGPFGACGFMGHDAHFCRRRFKFCKQVHHVGWCELFARFQNLAKFVRTSVDKSIVPEELHDIYSSGHLT